jgi:hypothetical protein
VPFNLLQTSAPEPFLAQPRPITSRANESSTSKAATTISIYPSCVLSVMGALQLVACILHADGFLARDCQNKTSNRRPPVSNGILLFLILDILDKKIHTD